MSDQTNTDIYFPWLGHILLFVGVKGPRLKALFLTNELHLNAILIATHDMIGP